MKPSFRDPPARVGDALEDVDTPALVIDLDALESNIAAMATFVPPRVRVRPHAKSHKCVAIAKLQVAAGSVGLCAQKISEAEPLVRGGIADVLVTNQVVGDRKLARFAELAAEHSDARLGICVDDASNVSAWSHAARVAGAQLDVYVELDVGQHRCGVTEPAEVVALARHVSEQRALRFAGVHAYLGAAQHIRAASDRRMAIDYAAGRARAAKDALVAANIRCDVVTGAGTGSFPYEIASGIYDEIQPGSYVLMDVDYAKNEVDGGTPTFGRALTLLSTVMSIGEGGERAVLDAGLKSQSTDCGPALPSFTGWHVRGVNDEHVILGRETPNARLALGDKVQLVPGHVDPTVNLHDWFVVVRGGRVVDVWPIEARGAFY